MTCNYTWGHFPKKIKVKSLSTWGKQFEEGANRRNMLKENLSHYWKKGIFIAPSYQRKDWTSSLCLLLCQSLMICVCVYFLFISITDLKTILHKAPSQLSFRFLLKLENKWLVKRTSAFLHLSSEYIKHVCPAHGLASNLRQEAVGWGILSNFFSMSCSPFLTVCLFLDLCTTSVLKIHDDAPSISLTL